MKIMIYQIWKHQELFLLQLVWLQIMFINPNKIYSPKMQDSKCPSE